MKKLLFYFPFVTLGLLLFLLTLSFFGKTLKPDDDYFTTNELLTNYAIYETVNPSNLADELKEIVSERINCVESNPTSRLEFFCLRDYRMSLMTLGKESINSAPNLGLFLSDIRDCPIVNSICLGQSGTIESCISLEALCLDNLLDMYWRGSPVVYNWQNRK
jgi:hypothetical protein